MPRRFLILLALVSLTWTASCQPAAVPTITPHAASAAAPTSPQPSVEAAVTTAAPSTAAAPAAMSAEVTSPLAISAMRAESYPGSDITLEATLPAGPGYNRYIASYESDGLTLFGLLTVPTGNKPAGGWPVILLNHGYIPPAEYSTEQSYEGVVSEMATAGYIVFKPDYRGNGSSPGMPVQPYVAPDDVTDSLNALASIKKYKDANPDRIGVWGHSMGGNVTLHELVLTGDIKAAVLMAGVVGNWTGILNWWKVRVATGVLTTQNDLQTEQLVSAMVQLQGTPQSNPGYWNAIDPTQFIADVQAPVLIQVGTADTVVPPAFSQDLAAQLQAAGKSVTLHTYPGADHNLSPETSAAVAEAIAFFDEYLY
jgi:uncharacterized protein